MRFTFLLLLAAVLTNAADGPFRPLPPLDLTKLEPSQFDRSEADLVFYLAHFERFANSVVETGPDRGFIKIHVWRAPKDNQPHNARIMENILSLAWFYTAKRPWNPYYGAPGLRDRLEAALDFWVRSQSPDGAFSEYKPGVWGLAPTAFATKFMGQAIPLLEKGPAIDPALLRRVIAAQRKALVFGLTDPAMFQHGRNYSNQFTNLWPGALAWLARGDDPEIRTLLAKRFAQTNPEFQSPAGYFYEAGGPDWSYNLGTHHSNLAGAYFYAAGTPMGNQLIEEERKYVEWLSYNAVPDGVRFILNRAVETRQSTSEVSFSYRTLLAQPVPLARAFVQTKESYEREIDETIRKQSATWPAVEDLRTGEFSAYSPYVFLHRAQPQWLPSDAEKKAARSLLPYIARDRFVHQHMDSRSPAVYTYVRRPGYYAAFNSGKLIRPQQRYGIGLIWSPTLGVMVQSQTNTADAAWGTRAAGAPQVYEAADLPARFPEEPKPGVRDLASPGEFSVEYPLGAKGRKRILYGDNFIRVEIDHPGAFVEQIPATHDALKLETTASKSIASPAKEHAVAGRPLRIIRLEAAGHLEYTLRF